MYVKFGLLLAELTLIFFLRPLLCAKLASRGFYKSGRAMNIVLPSAAMSVDELRTRDRVGVGCKSKFVPAQP